MMSPTDLENSILIHWGSKLRGKYKTCDAKSQVLYFPWKVRGPFLPFHLQLGIHPLPVAARAEKQCLGPDEVFAC